MTAVMSDLTSCLLSQLAAESYLDGDALDGRPIWVSPTDERDNRLRLGSNNYAIPGVALDPSAPDLVGKTRMTNSQIATFNGGFRIVHHLSNTMTGFSATLTQRVSDGMYILSMRSTEYQNDSDGGDWSRDGAADQEISNFGFAVAQIADSEGYYRWLRESGLLPTDAQFAVTGYSLGGHLATVFAEAHEDASGFKGAITFNGAGRGALTGQVKDLVSRAYEELAAPDAGFVLRPAQAGSLYTVDEYSRIGGLRDKILNGFGPPFAVSTVGSPEFIAGGKIEQVYGRADFQDREVVANSGIHSSNKIKVFIEDQPDVTGLGFLSFLDQFLSIKSDFGATHSIVLLADSLALADLLTTLDPSLKGEAIRDVMSLSSNVRGISGVRTPVAESNSMERVVQALMGIFGVDIKAFLESRGFSGVDLPVSDVGGGFGNLANRNAFYDAIDAVRQRIDPDGTFVIKSVKGLSANDILQIARQEDAEGIAVRYALMHGNSFVFVKDMALYEPFNKAGELTLRRTSPSGKMTDDYVFDRAQWLERLSYYNEFNARYDLQSTSINPSTKGDAIAIKFDDEETVWDDARTSSRIRRSADTDVTGFRAFGADGADLLGGGRKQDHVYGMAGADILVGQAGDDHLEGGDGSDVYELASMASIGGFGNDTILDADGKGVLRYTYTEGAISPSSTTKIASGAVFSLPEGGWQSADGKFTFEMRGADMVVSINGDAGGTLTLQDFRDGDFGIHLNQSSMKPNTFIRDFVGDKEDWDRSDEPGLQTEGDGFGNTVRADGLGDRPDLSWIDREDVFVGATDAVAERFRTAGGNDVVYADGVLGRLADVGGADYIDTGAGRDVVEAGPGNDWVEGGPDGDIIGGNDGDDTIYGDTSADGALAISRAIVDGESAEPAEGRGDLLSGGSGSDHVIGANRGDFLLGGSDSDVIAAGAGDDTIYGDGTLTFSAFDWGISREEIPSSGVNTYLVRSDTVVFSVPPTDGGSDAVYGGSGDDWIFAGAGDDYIEAGSGNDVVLGQAGNDILIGGDGSDSLGGDSAEDTAAGRAGDDFLDGGNGDDTLQGDGGGDVLYGGTGDDDLYGGEGDDLLYGGVGEDVLIGGAGKDTYVFNRGDGIEVIEDTAAGANDPEASVVILGEGISRADVKFRKGSLLIDLGPTDANDPLAGNDAIHFLNFDADFPELTAALGELRFADGAVMTYDDVLAQGFDIDGTEFDEVEGDALVGTSVTDRIRGFSGNDELAGRGGADVLEGDAGDDVLDGGDGDDQLFGGEGNDELGGGSGNDDMFGEAGDDNYAFNIGDGEDAIDDLDGESTLRFGPGIDPAAVSVSRYTGDTGEEWVRIAYAQNDAVSLKSGADARVVFDTGYEIKLSGLLGGLTLAGTAQPETIYGSDGNDTIDGKGGGDEIYAGAGDDVLVAGKHLFADAVYGEDGDDVFRVGTQSANLFGGAGFDSYELSGVTQGQVQISDDGGRIVIKDESAFASLNVADFGDVVYIEAPHFFITLQDDGNQVDLDQWSIESPAGTVSTLSDFAASRPTGVDRELANYRRQIVGGFLEAQSAVEAAGIDVALGPSGSAQYSGALVSEYIYDHVRYVTNQSYSHSSQVVIDVQTSDAPSIFAMGDDFTVTDTITEASTNVDVSTPRRSGRDFSKQAQPPVWVPINRPLPLATGYMRAIGSISYADAYPPLRGYWIYPDASAPGVLENVPILGGMRLTNRSHTVVSTLTLQEVYGGPSNNQIVTTGYAIVDAGSGDDIVTVTGLSALPLSEDSEFRVLIEGDSEPEIDYGEPVHVYGSVLYGNAGNDTLTGAAGDDVLIGGTGTDALDGGGGGDRYVLLDTDGVDLIADSGDDYALYERAYRLQNGEGSAAPLIAGNDYDAIESLINTFDEAVGGFVVQADRVELPFNLYSETGYADDVEFFVDDETLHIRGGSGVGVGIRLAQDWEAVGSGIEYVSFMDEDLFIRDALALAASDAQGMEISGGAEADVLHGGWGADLIEGHDGDDQIFGRNGNDTLEGGAGDDYLDGGAGGDLLHGQDGRDVARGGASNDELIESGHDHNFLDGGAGDDHLYVEGASQVIGGSGDDVIEVAGDAAVVSFNVGDGHDTIALAGEITVSVGGAVVDDDMGLRVEGRDVVFMVSSEDRIRLTRALPEDGWPKITLQRIDGSGIRRYDFGAVIEDRYVQLATNRESPFILADVLATHLLDSSADEVIGGEIAYRYAMRGQVDDLSVSEIHDVIDDDTFGTQPQLVEPIGTGVEQGTDGDDVLSGTAAADVIAGGAGNDALDGGLGDDTYVFNPGDGEDHIVDAGGFDTVTFGPGIADGDISLGLGSLLVRVGEHDAIHIEDFDPADALAARSIEAFRFSDGTELSYAQLVARGFDLTGTAGDDMIIGTNVSDSIAGGAGDDVLEGGAGDDVYSFNAGDGADTILDQSGADEIVLARGITADAIAVSESGGGITLTRRGTQDSIRIPGATREDPRIEAVQFSDGISWNSRDLVEHINDAPAAVVDVGEMVIVEDEPFEFALPAATFSDPDGWGTLAHEAAMSDGRALPDWLSFDAQLLTFSGTPSNRDVGVHDVMVTALDQDGLSASTTFTIAVLNVNDSPETVGSIPDRVIREDERATFSVSPIPFDDVDAGDVLTYTAAGRDGTAVPDWLSFDAAALGFAGVPGNADVGEYALIIMATDLAGATATADFNLTVENENDAPTVAASLPNKLGYQSAVLDFTIPSHTFIDMDAGDALTLTATSIGGTALPAWLGFDPAAGHFVGRPDPSEVGSYALTVTATDRQGASASTSFDLIVSDAGAYSSVYRGTKRDDAITSGPGNDWVEAGKGADVVSTGAGRDIVFGDKGDDSLTLGYGNDIGFGGDGKDIADGGPGNDLLVGGDGADKLYGGTGNDVLMGGEGKDELSGGEGNNLVVGGPGGDVIYGGSGHDVLAFNRHDGKAFVYGGDASLPSNRDTLSFGSGIAAGDIVLRRNGKDLVVKIDDDREEREGGDVSVTLKDWYGAGNHRAVTRLQIVGDRTEIYDFAALVSRFDAVTRGKSTPWRAGPAMSAVLMFSGAQQAIGGPLATEYGKTGTIASVGVATFGSVIGDDAFAVEPQKSANGDGATLAQFFARDDQDEDAWSGPGLPDLGHLGGDAHRGERSADDGSQQRGGTNGRSGGVKPPDLQAILDAMERFEHDVDARRVERPAPSDMPDRNDGVPGWAMRNALLQFHLTAPRDVMFGADESYPGANATSTPMVNISAAQAALGVPGFGRDAQSLCAFDGLREGLARLA